LFWTFLSPVLIAVPTGVPVDKRRDK